jgi:hypothetical protein
MPMTNLIQTIEPYSACPLCGCADLRPDFRVVIFGTELTWDRCARCTLVFQNPRLTAEAIAALYEATDYWGKSLSEQAAYRDYARHDALRIAHSRRRLTRIKKVSGITGDGFLTSGARPAFSASQRGKRASM